LGVGGFGGDRGLEDVDEGYGVVCVEKDFGEELAYEAAGAGDEDLHSDVVLLLLLAEVLRVSLS
jgi:hypothetical protein